MCRPENAQEIATPDFANFFLFITALYQSHGQIQCLTGVFQARNATAMVEVVADSHVINANSSHNVVDMIEHRIDAARAQKLADCTCEGAPGFRILEFPIELVGIVIIFRDAGRAPCRTDEPCRGVAL